LKTITSESHGIFAAGNMLIAANSILNKAIEESPLPLQVSPSEINPE
jgi:hypothetical protein